MASDVILPALNRCRAVALGKICGPRAPQVIWPPSAPDYYFDNWGPRALDTVLTTSVDCLDSTEASKGLVNQISARASLTDKSLGQELASIREESLRQILIDCLRVIKRHKARSNSKIHWVGTKEVWAIDLLPMLSQCFPEARFISIIRDPRAVINSLFRLAGTDPSQLAHLPSYLRHWRKHVALSFDFQTNPQLQSKLLVIRYESLLRDSESTLTALGEFLEEEASFWHQTSFHAATLSDNSSFIKTKGTLKPERDKAWTTELALPLRKSAQFMVGPEMLLCGYTSQIETNFNAVPELSGYMKILFGLPTGKWRSDSGNSSTEIRNELSRLFLLKHAGDPALQISCDAVLRNFLSYSVFTSVQRLSRLQPKKRRDFRREFII